MGAPLAIAAVVIIIGIVAWLLFNGGVLAKSAEEGVAERAEQAPTTEELRYLVPDGQDPAAIMFALEQHGYDSRVDEVAGRRFVSIPCPEGTDRHRDGARAAIAGADSRVREGVPLGGPVRFEDEPPR